MSTFVQGQDVTVNVLKGGGILKCLSNVKSLRVHANVEAVLRNYLGQRAPKTDQTYNGCEFELEVDHEDPSYMTLVDAIVAVAQHRTPDVSFTFGFKIQYPTGQTVRAMMRDVAFDPLGIEFGSRTDPMTSRLSGKGSMITNITGATSL